ncbi:hypothetical protein C4J81_09650 [Deltaproteobacteria bacterium Smac51]|nr:hypothetical protein C4J81_09650 [Deltaproteobacteria bacterium Smac51]
MNFSFLKTVARAAVTAELIKKIHEKLTQDNITVAAAESLTGGRVAAALTALPGSSVFFQGGVVAYSNQLKVELLGVPMEVIARHGAVSEECARAMATGVRRKLGVGAAVATTGIAGPEGGTAVKPVGLVWMAAVFGHTVITQKKVFTGDRDAITEASVTEALGLLYNTINK